MNPGGTIKLPKLRLDLQYSIHHQGDDRWYCVQDPLNGQFFRLGPREYALASLFNDGISPDDLIQQIALDPELTKQLGRPVTSGELMQLAAWLVRSGLCQTDQAARASSPYRKWVLNPLSMRIPLVPGHYIEQASKWIVPRINWFTCVAIVAMYCVALFFALANWKLFSEASSRLFVSDSHLWWMAAWLILKIAHELGHAVVAVRVGSHIRAAGFNVYFFAPIPYVDVSDLWTIPNRWQRIACSAAGILTELAIASIAIFIAVFSQSESIRYLCCAIAVTGTVTTLAFNANPLMRFDGYYILSDLLNIPNLWTHSQTAFSNWVKRILNPWKFAGQALPSVAYATYGMLSFFYRWTMTLTMAATAIVVWKSIGVLIVLWAAYAIYIDPWIKAIRRERAANAMRPPRETKSRERVWGVAAVVGLILALTVIPSPIQPSAPGVVTFYEPVQVNAESQGILEQVSVRVGEKVQAGQVIAVLRDQDLQVELQTKRLEAQSVQESMRAQQARGNLAELQAAEARLESLTSQLVQVETRFSRLTVTAPQDGIVVQLSVDHSLGQKIGVGAPICMIATSDGLEAKISASQRDLEAFRQAVGQSVAVNVVGASKRLGTVEKVELKGSAYLSDPLLAGVYNGPIPVEMSGENKGDGKQWKLLSPRFDVHVRLPESEGYVPGQMVWARVPGDSSSIAGVIGLWLKSKWDSLKHQVEG